jgi:RNA polymerase subunit RPABC4/transcription elongation factor Spt4
VPEATHCGCGVPFAPEDRYCPSCGSPVEQAGTSGTHCKCGGTLAPDERFCASCGAARAQGNIPLVTVACGSCGQRNRVATDRISTALCGGCGQPLAAQLLSCKRCRTGLAADEQFCPKCGFPLGASENVTYQDPVRDGATYRCPKCHAVLTAGSRKCGGCGVVFASSVPSSPGGAPGVGTGDRGGTASAASGSQAATVGGAVRETPFWMKAGNAAWLGAGLASCVLLFSVRSCAPHAPDPSAMPTPNQPFSSQLPIEPPTTYTQNPSALPPADFIAADPNALAALAAVGEGQSEYREYWTVFKNGAAVETEIPQLISVMARIRGRTGVGRELLLPIALGYVRGGRDVRDVEQRLNLLTEAHQMTPIQDGGIFSIAAQAAQGASFQAPLEQFLRTLARPELNGGEIGLASPIVQRVRTAVMELGTPSTR